LPYYLPFPSLDFGFRLGIWWVGEVSSHKTPPHPEKQSKKIVHHTNQKCPSKAFVAQRRPKTSAFYHSKSLADQNLDGPLRRKCSSLNLSAFVWQAWSLPNATIIPCLLHTRVKSYAALSGALMPNPHLNFSTLINSIPPLTVSGQ